MAVCLLRALHSKLLTRDFLKSIGVTDIDTGVLCHAAQESIQYLYFECPFSAYLWSLCKLKLGLTGKIIGTLQEEDNMIQIKFKKKVKYTILAKVALAADARHIWKERNERVF